jgi:hypothetical protein
MFEIRMLQIAATIGIAALGLTGKIDFTASIYLGFIVGIVVVILKSLVNKANNNLKTANQVKTANTGLYAKQRFK